jgi:1-acyl-sn-glycerol-3-phosphate acyltransferase
MLKNIFARFWAMWGAIVFLTTMFIIYIPLIFLYFFKEPKRSLYAYHLYKFWMHIFLPLIGVRIKVSGEKYFKKGENYVVICNHRSFMDIFVSTTQIPGPNKTIAKIEMSRIPIFGDIYKMGSILVDRKDPNSRRNSYSAMKNVLSSGLHMIIYPEGTRNKTKNILKDFHDGAFSLASETNTPIITAVIKGAAETLPNNKTFYLLPGKISLQFLPPITPAGEVKELRDKCYSIMKAELMSNNS